MLGKLDAVIKKIEDIRRNSCNQTKFELKLDPCRHVEKPITQV